MTQNQQERQELDRLCIEAWRNSLTAFETLAANKSTSKEKYAELKEQTKINPHLNFRQREALIARVDGVLDGSFGKTKTTEQLSHTKTNSKPVNNHAIK